MCTYIIYTNPGADVPLLMATTRDENPQRETSPIMVWDKAELFLEPAHIGKIHLEVLKQNGVERYLNAKIHAPRDVLGGTFLAKNRHGLIAAVNNRENCYFTNTAPPKGVVDLRKMPRGGLALDAASFGTAADAVACLWPALIEMQTNNVRKYSCFNLVIADAQGAYVMANAVRGDIQNRAEPALETRDIGDFSVALWHLTPGKTHMLAGYDVNDFDRSVRTQKHLPVFRGEQDSVSGSPLALPRPADLSSWQPWIDQIAWRDDYRHNPFGHSIFQPNPHTTPTQGIGDPGWVTLSTHLMLQKNDGEMEWHTLNGWLNDAASSRVQERAVKTNLGS